MRILRKIFLILVSINLLCSCSSVYKIDLTDLKTKESASLYIPNHVVLGQIDGKNVSTPFCTGIGCNAGIEILFSPGEHKFDVKIGTAKIRQPKFVSVSHTFKKGEKYRLFYYIKDSEVSYSVEKF